MKTTITIITGALCLTASAHAQQAVQWRVSDGGNGHWYRFDSSPNPQPWNAARQRSALAGGHLACIGSLAEQQFLISIAPDYQDESGGQAWLGGYQDTTAPDFSEPHGGWRWVSGESMTFVGWFNSGTGFGADFMTLAKDINGNYGWNDLWGDYFGGRRFAFTEWSADCNNDGIVDYGQVLEGELSDADFDNIPDCCENGTPCSGIDSGRQLHLRFDGSYADSGPYARAIQPTGVSFGAAPDGSTSGAAIFSGVSSDIRVSGVPIPTNNGFSWSLWLRCDDVGGPPGGSGQPIIQRIEAVGNNLMSPSMWVRPSGAIGFGSYSFATGGSSVESAAGTVQPDQWIHVACTSAPSGSRTIFVNGAQIASGMSPDYGQPLGLVLIGRDRLDCCSPFRGAIDDLRIYDRCLRAEEVVEIYEKVRNCPGDLDANRSVNGADLGQLLFQWGAANAATTADINRDGQVDGADLGLLLSFWGPCTN